jgi:hypothetical protein
MSASCLLPDFCKKSIDLAEVQPLNPNKYACNWIRGYLQQYQHQTDSKLGCHQIKLLVN